MRLLLLTLLFSCLIVRAQALTYTPTVGVSLQPYTVGSGGVVANTLVQFDGAGNAVAATTDYQGIAMQTASAGGQVQIAAEGGSTWACIFENAAVAGDLAVRGTTNKTYCRDSGQTSQSVASIPAGTKIIGSIQTSGSSGQGASVRLYGLGVRGQALSSGTSFPASCSAGQQFIRTDQTAGANAYICDGANTFQAVAGGTSTGTGPFSVTGQTSNSTPATPSSGNAALFFPSSGGPEAQDASGKIYAMPSSTILNAPANGFWAGPTSGSNAAPVYRALTYPDLPPLTSGHFIVGNASVATDTAMSGDCTLSSAGAVSCSKVLDVAVGTAISSTGTIAPTSPIVHVTGTATVTNISVPSGCGSTGIGCVVRITQSVS